MDLRSYLRGLGAGLFIAAVLMGIATGRNNAQMSDAEVKERAKALGMVEENGTLSGTIGKKVTDKEDSETTNAADDMMSKKTEDDPLLKSYRKNNTVGKEDSHTKLADILEKQKNDSEELNADGDTERTDLPEADMKGFTTKTGSVETDATKENIDKTGSVETDATKENVDKTGSVDIKIDGANSKKTDIVQSDAGEAATKEDYYTLEIASGISSYDVARLLEKGGLVDSASKFDSYMCEHNYDSKINHGVFKIKKKSTYEEIAKLLIGN